MTATEIVFSIIIAILLIGLASFLFNAAKLFRVWAVNEMAEFNDKYKDKYKNRIGGDHD